MKQLSRIALSFILAWTCVSSAMGDEKCVTSCSRAEVYIFRGAGGYWPRVAAMAELMSSRGYCPHVHYSRELSRLTTEVVNQQGTGGSINLIGYSYGASTAVRMARDLMAHGIFVDRMFLIECYDHPEIPPNVRYCVNFYESRHLDRLTPFRGTPACAIESSSTVLIDIDISCHPEWQEVRRNNHFTISADPIVQEFGAQQFPDLTQQAPSQIPAVGSGPTFQQPTDTPALIAPEPQIGNPADGPQNSADRAQRPELSGIPRIRAPYTSSPQPAVR